MKDDTQEELNRSAKQIIMDAAIRSLYAHSAMGLKAMVLVVDVPDTMRKELREIGLALKLTVLSRDEVAFVNEGDLAA